MKRVVIKERLYSFFFSYRNVAVIWGILVVIAFVLKFLRGHDNNYLIYKNVFWHVWDRLSIFGEYPAEYFDKNHYGPFFSLIVGPFAVLPDWLGAFLWLLFLSFFLFWAVKKLPVSKKEHLFIYWFCSLELLSALFMFQFNIAITAILIFSYALIDKGKDTYATFFIVLGLFVKLYGIVGVCFFFFSKDKRKFILSFLGWSILFFVLPMFISSPSYIIGQYVAWFEELIYKNSTNTFSPYQNVSLLGMVRKISASGSYSDLWVILPGLVLFALPYVRINQYKYQGFRLSLLASALLFILLFSTGTESSSYIIGFCGVAIWYIAVSRKNNKVDMSLLIFTFAFVVLCTSDIVPREIRYNYIRPYALKALPCFVVWLKIIYEMCTFDYSEKQIQ